MNMSLIDIIVLLLCLVLFLLAFLALLFCHSYEVILKEQKKKDGSDTDECPLKKNKNTDSRKDGEGEKEDVKSSNENRKEIV